ncbi:hypothetical protein [Paenibacillus riograndensis]|uniref:Putative membrane protein n=1 Tax=Paenibacillus riograndensis SBR5 TaxID=1073571 RepID=A0A0E4HDW1_9BACL|nr:hypothetical protein [Paenibacillus riograndensis]CQR55659.1 putative membrane protein [Paenibacillus riograndensis SBR5]
MRTNTHTLRKLSGYLFRQPLRLIIVLVLTIAAAGLTLLGPYLTGVALDRYIIPGQYSGLLQLCLLLLGLYLLGSLVRVGCKAIFSLISLSGQCEACARNCFSICSGCLFLFLPAKATGN